jgi:outer membrane receptor protein involved in Fe transport
VSSDFSRKAGAAVALFVLLLGVQAAGQSLTASISGKVTDQTGGALPGATVVITNADTNAIPWQGVADAGGSYNAPSLPVGRYNIQVSLAGFKSVSVAGVRLEVGQKANIPVSLPAGERAETITVVGASLGRLETEDSSMGIVIDTAAVKNLPLPNRSILNLLTLAGGVSSGGDASGNINTAQLSINGSRTLNSEFNIDGVSAVSGSTGGVGRFPSAEAIREFKVQTAGYSAEFGRSVGGFVNVVINSGTNELHGGVYEYNRNERFNANNFFANHVYAFLPAATQARCDAEPDNFLLDGTCGRRARDRSNRFGVKLGGPVRIPGLYKGDNKTFFFVNYDAFRQTNPAAPTSTIPDEAFRSGNFSAAPATVVINDPLTGLPFPNRTIPASRIDPAAARIMALLPLPNASGTADAANGRATGNFVNDASLKPTEDEITVRIDHQAGSKARLFARLTYYDVFSPSAANIPGPLNNSTGDATTKGYQVTTGWTHIWSPALLMDVNLGYYRNDPETVVPSAGLDVAGTYGIARSVYPASPKLVLAGWQTLGLNDNTLRSQIDNNYHASAALTWVHSDHTTKVGGQYRKNSFNIFNPGDAFTGTYNFTGEVTSPTKAANNPVQSLADFLLGQVKTSFYELPQPRTVRQNDNIGLFVQDDWKATPKLTLNLGLRYEYEAPMTIEGDVYSRMDIAPATLGRLLVAGRNSSRTTDLAGDKLNFAPRVGFAYTLNDKTVVRSAFGLFYGQIFSNLGGVVTYPGFTIRQNFANLGAGVAQPFRLSEGMPLTATQTDDPFFVERGTSPASPLSVQGSGNNQYGSVSPLPYTMQWNAGVQRQLPGGAILDVSYIGSRGKNLPVGRNFNAVPLDKTEAVALAGTALAAQQARPNPNVTAFSAFVHEGDSWYNSAQVRLARKFTNRFSLQGTYTFSKSIDTGSGVFNFSQPNGLDVGDLAGAPGISANQNRGLSAFDRPHTFVMAAQYETGGPRLVKGFLVSAIVTARSGLTDTIAQTNLADWNIMPVLPAASSLQQRPNVKPGASTNVKVAQVEEGQNIRYLMPASDPNFPLTPSGPFATGSGATRRITVPFLQQAGTLGRSTVRGPGEFNVDAALARRFEVTKRYSFTLRAEAFNVFNHTNLNSPNATLTVAADPSGNAIFNSPNFGLITSAKSSRKMQIVARFDF